MAQTKQLKIKKKHWVQILAPGFLQHTLLGETYIGEPQEAKGRMVTVSMMTLTGDPKRQSMHASFQIDGVKDGCLTTSINGVSMLPSSIKRMVRRGKERVDDSFLAVTKDGKKLRIKPLVITRQSTPRSVCSSIQRKAKELVIHCLARSTLEELWQDLVNYKIQKEISHSLSKVYLVQIFDIRRFVVVGTGTPPEISLEGQPAASEDTPSEDPSEKSNRKSRIRKVPIEDSQAPEETSPSVEASSSSPAEIAG